MDRIASKWVRTFFLFAFSASGSLIGCERSQPTRENTTAPTPSATAPTLKVVEMTLGGKTFTLEVADTSDAQQTGLMHRKSMPADHGMIFVFRGESPRSFWMKNTLIPLDIIYVSATGKVVNISQMKPLDETGVPSWEPAKYAIELNLGAASDAGVHVGDLLHIPASCREPRR